MGSADLRDADAMEAALAEHSERSKPAQFSLTLDEAGVLAEHVSTVRSVLASIKREHVPVARGRDVAPMLERLDSALRRCTTGRELSPADCDDVTYILERAHDLVAAIHAKTRDRPTMAAASLAFAATTNAATLIAAARARDSGRSAG